MEVTFQIDLADYQAFLRAIKYSPFRWLMWIVVPTFVLTHGVMLLVYSPYRAVFSFSNPKFWIVQSTTLFATLMICALFGLIMRSIIKSRFLESNVLDKSTIFAADELSVSEKGEPSTHSFLWPAVQRVIETDTHFFLLLARQSGFIIPKRAFDSPAECAQFGAFLNAKWAQHHPDAAPIAMAK